MNDNSFEGYHVSRVTAVVGEAYTVKAAIRTLTVRDLCTTHEKFWS